MTAAGYLLRTWPLLFFILFTPYFPSNAAQSTSCPRISTAEASQLMKSLAADIHRHNQLYYEKAQPEISDAAYDRLFARLVELEGCFPGLAAAD